ncbi:MAG: flagellar hook-length control protein FliK [Devosiaceae bacterium]|nr:flagellar hook-length control protein FliK [Devosiaceae bacterium]
MKIPSDSSANINSTRSGVLRALGLRPGQSFTAQVISNSPDGLTQLKVGSQQISLNLPSKPQLGVMLKFLFQSGGEKPQITLMGEATSNSKTTQSTQPPQPNQTTQNQTTQNSATKITISTQQANAQINTQQAANPQNPAPQNQVPQSPQAQTSTTTSVPLPPATQAKLQLLVGQTVSAKVSGTTTNGQTNFTIGSTQFSAPIASNPPIGTVLQFLVKSENGQARLVLSEPNISITQQAQAKPTAQNPYNNQVIKNTTTSSTTQNLQQNQNIAPPITNPLAQAISSAIPLALAQQDSLTALFANLMGLQKQNIKLEPTVKKAVQQLLDGQLKLDGKTLTGNVIKQAISRSGNFLESALSGKMQSFTTSPSPSPAQQISLAQGDMKALLLSLRSSLLKWLGEQPASQKTLENQIPPPRKGVLPRASPPNSQRLPEGLDAKNIGAALLRQTDSALSRLRLFQISSLPDQAARSTISNEINLELPFSLGNESNIIRFQIERDGSNKYGNNEQSLSLRFAMNLQSLGEVGANISFRLGKVGAMIWAQEEETAKQLNDMLPELASSLEARGLETNFIRVRHGAPEKDKVKKGDFVNDLL